MSKRQRKAGTGEKALREAADRLSADPEEAGRALPAKEREAFRKSQESVVEARRSAETREGLLRIN